jgi:uncharacterized protein YuzE
MANESEISEQYDQESDVYYVTFKTGEPSIVKEHNDRLLVEVGIFTGFPTGFRILNYTKHKRTARVFTAIFKEAFRKARLENTRHLETRERRISSLFEKVAAA